MRLESTAAAAAAAMRKQDGNGRGRFGTGMASWPHGSGARKRGDHALTGAAHSSDERGSSKGWVDVVILFGHHAKACSPHQAGEAYSCMRGPFLANGLRLSSDNHRVARSDQHTHLKPHQRMQVKRQSMDPKI